jgi:hypothetical protein
VDPATLRRALEAQIARAADLQRTARELQATAAEAVTRVRATIAAARALRQRRQQRR